MGLLGGTRACTRSDRDRSGRTMAWEAVFLGLQIVNTARRYKANCLFNAVGASPKASSALIFWVTVRDSSRTCKTSSALILRRAVITSSLELQYVLSAIQRDHIDSSAARGVFGRSTDRSKSRSAEASAGGGGIERCLHACSTGCIPREDEEAKEGPDEDAEEDVPVVIHGQEHDHVRDCKLQRVDEGANGLLEHGRDMTASSQRSRTLPVSQ